MNTKLKRVIAIIEAIALNAGIFVTAAEFKNPKMTATFDITEPQYHNFNQYLNQWNYNPATQTQANVSPITLENDLFEKAYAYGWGGGAGNAYAWKSYLEIPVDVPKYDDSDMLYVSFYYKCPETFQCNGTKTNVTGEVLANHIIRDQYDRFLNLTTGYNGSNNLHITLTADNEWHKIEFYNPASDTKGKRLADGVLRMYPIAHITDPFAILISDLRVGVLHSNGAAYNNDKVYTETGWFMQQINEPTEILVNGLSMDMTKADMEIYSNTVEPTIEVTGSDYVLEKLGTGEYKLTPTAYGYDISQGDDGIVKYRERGFEHDTAGWIYNSGAISVNEIRNGDLKSDKSYYLHLNYEEGFYVDDMLAVGEIPAGEKYSYKKSFDKPESGKLTAVIAAYEKESKRLVEILSSDYAFADGDKKAHISIDMNKDNSDDTLYFKVFILDGTDTMMPLTECRTTASISIE